MGWKVLLPVVLECTQKTSIFPQSDPSQQILLTEPFEQKDMTVLVRTTTIGYSENVLNSSKISFKLTTIK